MFTPAEFTDRFNRLAAEVRIDTLHRKRLRWLARSAQKIADTRGASNIEAAQAAFIALLDKPLQRGESGYVTKALKPHMEAVQKAIAEATEFLPMEFHKRVYGGEWDRISKVLLGAASEMDRAIRIKSEKPGVRVKESEEQTDSEVLQPSASSDSGVENHASA